MAEQHENPYAALERIFHEPNRLAILSCLCGAPEGMRFVALKEACNLTDGNLNRHLKTLKDAGCVVIEKSFVDSKPQTLVFLSDSGRDSFLQYLKALEAVLKKAAKRAKAASLDRKGSRRGAYPSTRPAKA